MNEITLIRKDILSMSSREIAELTGSTHDNVLKTIRKLVIEGVVFGNETPYVHPQNGQTYSEYLLSFRNTMIVVSGYSAELRAKIIDRWQELESQVAKPAELSTLEILAIAMESEKGRLLAIEQRDHAIATKAQIGSRREATAMATASKARREADKLRDELGFSARHATILQVEDATGIDADYVPLRRWCKANEVTPVTVPDKRYPRGVKAWPAGAWLDVYRIDLGLLFGEAA